jgi:putative addiction module killer protein
MMPPRPWYFAQRGALLILFLCGGDKRTQQCDIRRAIEILGELAD